MRRLPVLLLLFALTALQLGCGRDDATRLPAGSPFLGQWEQDKSPDAVAHWLAETEKAWQHEVPAEDVATSPLEQEIREALHNMGIRALPEDLDRRLEFLRQQYMKVEDRLTIQASGIALVRHPSGAEEAYRVRDVGGVLQIYMPGEADPIGTITMRGSRLELRLLDGPSTLWARTKP